MYEKKLEETFKRIFALNKVRYEEPGESREQNCLFVTIEVSKNLISASEESAEVRGTAIMYGPADKLTFGFFSKRIERADHLDTKDLHFYDFESNTKMYQNIVQRGFSFVYFYKNQYDPKKGQLTEIEFQCEG